MSENKKHKTLEDSDGNKSSKRAWGSILLTIASVLSFILFYFCIIHGDYDKALKIIDSYLYAGSGLLGITVVEKLAKSISAKLTMPTVKQNQKKI
jgi:hypothetical protein